MPVTPSHKSGRITRRRVLAAGAAGLLALTRAPALAAPLRRRRGGIARNVDRVITTFQLVEHSGSASDCIKRIGLPIKAGDCPPGTVLGITGGSGDIDFQIDKISTGEFGEGTIFATAWVRDNVNFGPNESRTYQLVARPGGSYNNVNSHTLSDLLAGHDFRLDFTGVTGSTTGAQPDVSAVMNNHALTPTRVYATPIESGSVALTFKMWGMAKQSGGTGTEHVHLKTYDFITGLFDKTGALVAWEPLFLVGQDWWSIAGKEKLTYTATFNDGATLIERYGGSFNSAGVRASIINHPYHQRWATRRLADDNEHAAEHRIGRPRSTILYVFDQVYWESTNLVPPLDLSLRAGAYMPTQVTTGPAYGVYKPNLLQPCSSQSHQPAIDNTGGSQSRGILPGQDCIAFVTQAAADVRTMRVNGQVGHHVPYHRRSNRTRTKPGDSVPDIASTPVSLIMLDDRGTNTPSSYYDFTSYGLPIPVHAYASSSTTVAFRDGFIQPSGGYAVSPSNTWGPSTAPTHAGSYSQYDYLLEGSPDLLEAIIDLAINVSQQQNDVGGAGALLWYQGTGRNIFGAPATKWAGVSMRPAGGNVREAGWAAVLASHAWITPDYEENARYLRTYIKHQAKFINAHVQYLPSTWTGSWWPIGTVGGTAPEISWHVFLIGMGCWTALGITRDETWRPMCEKITTLPLWYGTADRVGHAASFEYQTRPDDNLDWNATTNDFFQNMLFEHSQHQGALNVIATASTGQISQVATRSNIQMAPNDLFVFSDKDDGGAVVPVPSEVQLGKIYYIRSPVGNASDPFRISSTPDDTGLINFATDYPNISGSILNQNASDPSKYHGTIYGADEYVWMAWAVLKLARRFGYAGVTDAALANYQKWADVYYDPLNLHSSADPYIVWALTV